MSVNQTLLRYLALQTNYVVNPFFEPLEGDPTDASVSTIPNPMSVCYGSAPGWFPFGWAQAGSFANAALDGAGINKFTESASAIATGGLTITQKPGFQFGVVQQLWRASTALPNRRVRVMGRYVVLSNPDNLAGIHIALKAKYENVTIGTAATTGNIATYSFSNLVTDNLAPFASVAVGDTMWLGDAGLPSGGGGANALYGVRAKSANDTLQITGTDLPGGTVSKSPQIPYEVITGNNWVSNKAIRLDVVPRPQHIISLQHQQSPSASMLYGDELLVRAWDYLRAQPEGLTPVVNTAPPAVILSLGREAKGLNDGGVGAKSAGCSAFYLSEEWLNDGIADQTLVSETITGVNTTGEQTFDVEVDLGDLMSANANGTGLWLTVMPVAPGNIASMTASAKIAVLAVTVSLVPADGSVQEVIDSQAPALRQSGGPLAFSGFPAKFLQRYPIYKHCVAPLDVMTTPAGAANAQVVDTTLNPTAVATNSRIGASRAVSSINATVSTPSISKFPSATPDVSMLSNTLHISKQSGIPSGGSILGAAFSVETFAAQTSNVSCSLVSTTSVFTPSIYATVDPTLHATQDVCLWTLSAPGVATASTVDRNLVGSHWPSFGGTDFSSIPRKHSTSDLWFHLTFPTVDIGMDFSVRSGYIHYVVDPRWGNALWSK